MTFQELNNVQAERDAALLHVAALEVEVARLMDENALLGELANARDVADLIAWRDDYTATDAPQQPYWDELAAARAGREKS